LAVYNAHLHPARDYSEHMIQVVWDPGTYCSFATTALQLKICDFPGETFKGFEML